MRKIISMAAILSAVALTSGCDKTRETFGLKRNQVDEFGVVDRQPLSTPPNYKLRPPMPGTKSLAHKTVDQKAKMAILGSSSGYTNIPASKGEKALLASAGATNLDPHVREKVSAENPVSKKEELSSVGEDLVFWKEGSNKKDGDVIDPTVENKKHNG